MQLSLHFIESLIYKEALTLASVKASLYINDSIKCNDNCILCNSLIPSVSNKNCNFANISVLVVLSAVCVLIRFVLCRLALLSRKTTHIEVPIAVPKILKKFACGAN